MNAEKYDYYIKVGNDCGNSEQDMFIDKVLVKQPNIYAVAVSGVPGREKDNPEAIAEQLLDNILVDVGTPTCLTAGTYYIGSYALKSGENTTNLKIGVSEKHREELPIINTVSNIAAYMVQHHFKTHREFPKELRIGVEMATALPVVEYHLVPDARTIFRDKFYNGPHMVTVRIGSKRVVVKIEFTKVYVLAEGTTVVFALQRDENGVERDSDMFEQYMQDYPDRTDIKGSFFKGKRILHVDIGDGTTDLPMTIGNRPNPDFITGIKNGAGYAIEKALRKFRYDHGFGANFSRQDFSEILKDSNHRYHNEAHAATDAFLKQQASEISAAVDDEIVNAKKEVDIVLVYGGGSVLMKKFLHEQLHEVLKKHKGIELVYVPAKYAVTMNAVGLSDFVHSDIFPTVVARENSDDNLKRSVEVIS